MGLWKRLRLSRQPDGTSLPVGIAVLLVGTVLVLLGYLWEGTWEDVFIEVGAAAAVGGIVLLYKQRFWRQAGAAAAEDITSTRTEAIEQRLVKLESMDERATRLGPLLPKTSPLQGQKRLSSGLSSWRASATSKLGSVTAYRKRLSGSSRL